MISYIKRNIKGN